ncbi:MAG: phytase [Acidimicrobiia bacterium]
MPAIPSQAPPRSSRRTVCALLVLALLASLAAFLTPARADQPTTDAAPTVETAPVETDGTTDDPAIWVDADDPTKSLVFGANDASGIGIYDLSGVEREAITADGPTTGIDIRRGVSLGGQTVDVLAAANEGTVRFYTIDATGALTNMTAGTGAITPAWPSGGGKINGLCLYQSSLSGQSRTYVFAYAPNGQMEQLELVDNAGKIDVNLVRGGSLGAWDVSATSGSTLSGCVADDEQHTLYVAEKTKAIWRYGAEPGDLITGPVSVDVPAPTGHFTPNLGGLALVRTGPATGYLLASSQGVDDTPEADSFMVYRREGNNEFVRAFHVIAGAVDGCQSTRGIDAVAANLGPAFPDGVFVCQDLHNTPASGEQNYKLVPLAAIADMTPVAEPTTTTTAPPSESTTTTTTAPANQPPAARRSGYWMVGADGKVYPFGDAKSLGDAPVGAGTEAVDLEPTPSGAGYWIVDAAGHVFANGDARWLGNAEEARLIAGEKVTSLSSTGTGNGYWIFTTRGRVLPVGDAVFHGDVSAITLNGPVLDSIPTASGKGYYMVASDGGIFTFGDAVFHGSTGSIKLNAPVQSLVPDPDGQGYWLVASDGGVFSFETVFRGSMGGTPLNKPVTGMVPFGNGYLMVAEDGGIFNFSDKAFHGSLGSTPPARPVVSVAALDLPVL